MIGVIIQARMASTRLPGKTLADIAGKPMLARVVERVQRIQGVDMVGIATTTSPADDPIVGFAFERGLPVVRGSEADVLDRFYLAAQEWNTSVIIRITPDCPLLDPQVSGLVLQRFLETEDSLDYVSNVTPRTFPDGLDTEVFSFAALERVWRKARLPSEREHVTKYLVNNPRGFRMANLACDADYSQHRWTVDEAQDLEFVRAVLSGIGEDVHDFRAVLEYVEAHPEVKKLNQDTVPDAGYYRSLAADPPVPPQRRPLEVSRRLRQRADWLIPLGTQTFSKAQSQFVQGAAPAFLERGKGSHVWDVDGNRYIDYIMGLGPIILGYNHPPVSEAVSQQMQKGAIFSLAHPLEAEVSELLVELIPCAEMVRFGKNGSDATSGAVRVARAYTGREVVACCGYHGWQDWYIGATTRNNGVPKAVRELTVPFEYNDIGSLERVFEQHSHNVAAVIMEPVGVIEPQDGFLQDVKEIAHREGALLIFDEVITGFRLALGGAQEYFGVTPDLACLGKAIANGFPLSAIVGRRDVMSLFEEVFFSSTFGGETLSLAACAATIKELRERDVIGRLWSQGRRLQDGYNVLAREFGVEAYTACIGLPPHTVMTFKDADGVDSPAQKSLFQQECLKRGILLSVGHNLCYAHSDEDVDYTLRVYRTSLEVLSQAVREGDILERLEGAPVQSVFRQP